MSLEGQRFYPGERATPAELLALADEYRAAAEALFAHGRKGPVENVAPYRLLAIHAIELYLNAVLVDQQCSRGELRSLHHNLAFRAARVSSAKLQLRNRTRDHLDRLTGNREYLIARYDPAQSEVSELTRLAATLKEIAEKAGRVVRPAKPSPR